MIEEVLDGQGNKLALIVTNRKVIEPGLTFYSDERDGLQVGAMRWPEGHVIQAHVHNLVERRMVGTPEVLFLRDGTLGCEFYDGEGRKVWSATLEAGDVLIQLSGGHGFVALSEVVIEEVKVGPWLGTLDKRKL